MSSGSPGRPIGVPVEELPAQGVVGEHDVERAGGHAADVDGVDPHPRGQLGRDVARHPIERRLGRAVGDEHRLGHAGRARRDVDHGAPADGVDHLPRRQLGQRQRRGHVEGEGPGHEALARVHGRPGHGAAGVVDQDVEPAELLDRPRSPAARRRRRRSRRSARRGPGGRGTRTCAATSSRSDSVRAASATSAPASANPMAIPRPIPSPAPVTIATLPATEKRSRIMPGRRRSMPAGPGASPERRGRPPEASRGRSAGRARPGRRTGWR